MRRMAGIVMVVALTAALAVALVDVMAAGRMARRAPARTIEQLNAELDSRDPAVRREAARQLGEQLGSAPASDSAR